MKRETDTSEMTLREAIRALVQYVRAYPERMLLAEAGGCGWWGTEGASRRSGWEDVDVFRGGILRLAECMEHTSVVEADAWTLIAVGRVLQSARVEPEVWRDESEVVWRAL